MHWLTITLLCALSLAASDSVAKKYLSHLDLRSLTLIRLSFAGLLMAPLLLDVEISNLPRDFWLWMLVSVPGEIIAMLLYMKAIRDHALSGTVPYLAFTPMFTILSGWLILGETVSLGGATGILLIVFGAWLLNLPESRLNSSLGRSDLLRHLDPFQNIFRNPGSRYMLVAAIIYSITASTSKAAMGYMGSQQFGAFYFASVGIAAALLFGRSGIGVVRKNFWPAVIVAGLMAIMVYLHFRAMELVEAAYMISVKRTSLLFGIIFGVLFFKEKHLGMHLFAASIMLAGVFVIGVL
jgi:drug/metabolite transporter (DMT)-like permease